MRTTPVTVCVPIRCPSCGKVHQTEISIKPPHTPLGIPSHSILSKTKAKGFPSFLSPSPKRFVRPSKEEVAEYITKISGLFSADEFISYYDSAGWTIGKRCKPMKDWKGACRYWKSKNRKTNATTAIVPQVWTDDKVLKVAARFAEVFHESKPTQEILSFTNSVMTEGWDSLPKVVKIALANTGGKPSLAKMYAGFLINKYDGWSSLEPKFCKVVTSSAWKKFLTVLEREILCISFKTGDRLS